MTPRLCRTFQTAPAAVPRENTAKYLESGLTATGFRAPDWLVPDVEDGTAPNMKATGLDNVVGLLPNADVTGEVFPRVEWAWNDPDMRARGRDQIETLVTEVGDHVDGVVVPKVGGVADVARALETVASIETDHGFPDGTIEVAVIVETGRARSALSEIARLGWDDRLAALVFGPVDYAADLGARVLDDAPYQWPGLLEVLSNEASANDILAVGGPFDRLFTTRAGVTAYNVDGYADQVEFEATIGLDGSWSLHPNQTVQANHIHTPTPAELERDVSKIERFNDAKSSGTGAVAIDGQMVDEATFKGFTNTVDTVRQIHRVHPEQVEERFDGALLERAIAVDLGDD